MKRFLKVGFMTAMTLMLSAAMFTSCEKNEGEGPGTDAPDEGAVLYEMDMGGQSILYLTTWKGGRGTLERTDQCVNGLRMATIGSQKDREIWSYNPYSKWTLQPWNDSEFTPSDEEDPDMKMKKTGSMTVLGKKCNVYEGESSTYDMRIKTAYWKGIVLYQEVETYGIQTTQTAIAVETEGIPDKAFTQTLDIDWIDGFYCNN